MPRGDICPKDLQVLRLLDNIASRFEADAGFRLPGVGAHDVLPEYAARFGVGEVVDEQRMDELARNGLLTLAHKGHDGNLYALTNEAEQLLRGLKAA